MVEVLYSSYITDESNENGPFDLAAKFAGARIVSLVFTVHQSGASPSTAGVKAEIQHSDTENGMYQPVPNAVLQVMGTGSQADLIVDIEPTIFKPFCKIVLAGVGTGDPAGGGSVTAVW